MIQRGVEKGGSVWEISEIEPLQMQIVIQKLFTPEDKRNTQANYFRLILAKPRLTLV